jgi:glycine cleavage system pyridoxal-binding protein P
VTPYFWVRRLISPYVFQDVELAESVWVTTTMYVKGLRQSTCDPKHKQTYIDRVWTAAKIAKAKDISAKTGVNVGIFLRKLKKDSSKIADTSKVYLDQVSLLCQNLQQLKDSVCMCIVL